MVSGSATLFPRFDGLEVSGAKRPRQLEDENSKLNKLLIEAMEETAMLKAITSKNGSARRQA